MKRSEIPEPASLELQMLTVSDPAARSHMMRHVIALRKLLTGRMSDRDVPGLMIGTTFGVSDGAEAAYTVSTEIDGIARILIAFDVDDAKGPPQGYGLFLKEEGRVRMYDYAGPWKPAGVGRALLSAANDLGGGGFFAYQRKTMVRVATPPSGQFAPGYERAKARVAALADSREVRALNPKIFGFVGLED